ncbi:hypothetical protein HDK90DRAFT_258548 [Phyllosticta capitalensis]|uniref:Uncharacterized protein n=1 Tax=Phyllosticta capitalensis TaxID=121624 RepID=A0ABR1YQZ6_9PEZI
MRGKSAMRPLTSAKASTRARLLANGRNSRAIQKCQGGNNSPGGSSKKIMLQKNMEAILQLFGQHEISTTFTTSWRRCPSFSINLVRKQRHVLLRLCLMVFSLHGNPRQILGKSPKAVRSSFFDFAVSTSWTQHLRRSDGRSKNANATKKSKAMVWSVHRQSIQRAKDRKEHANLNLYLPPCCDAATRQHSGRRLIWTVKRKRLLIFGILDLRQLRRAHAKLLVPDRLDQLVASGDNKPAQVPRTYPHSCSMRWEQWQLILDLTLFNLPGVSRNAWKGAVKAANDARHVVSSLSVFAVDFPRLRGRRRYLL